MRRGIWFALVTAASLLALPGAEIRAEDEADYRACREEKDLTLAKAACSRALAAPGLDGLKRAKILYNRAKILTDQRQRHEAIADYSAILKDYPREHNVLNERGRLYRRLGDYDRAIEDFTKAIDLRPDDAAYLSNRGLAYKQKGDYSRALADYDASLRLAPDDNVTLHNRGVLYRSLKRYDQALADLNRSLSLDPGDASTMTEIGRTYAEQERHNEAIAHFDRAIAQRPDDGGPWFRRGLSFRRLGRHELALRDLEQAEKLGITDPELLAALTSERRFASVDSVLKAAGASRAADTGGTASPGTAGASSAHAGTPARRPANPDFDMGGELDF